MAQVSQSQRPESSPTDPEWEEEEEKKSAADKRGLFYASSS